jgi:hypothetical protein
MTPNIENWWILKICNRKRKVVYREIMIMKNDYSIESNLSLVNENHYTIKSYNRTRNRKHRECKKYFDKK